MAFAIIRTEKRNASNNVGSIKHNFRDCLQENLKENINQARSSMNHYYGIKTAKDMFTYVKDNINPLVSRKDNVILMEVLLTASPEYFAGKNEGEIKKWFNDNIDFMKQKYGDNFVCAQLHLDETTPHIHCYVKPVERVIEQGKEVCKLNAKKLFNRDELLALQEEYPKFLQTRGHNLTRGSEKSVSKHQDLKTYYKEVNKAVGKEIKVVDKLGEEINKIIDNVEVPLLSTPKTVKEIIKKVVYEQVKKSLKKYHYAISQFKVMEKEIKLNITLKTKLEEVKKDIEEIDDVKQKNIQLNKELTSAIDRNKKYISELEQAKQENEKLKKDVGNRFELLKENYQKELQKQQQEINKLTKGKDKNLSL